MRRERARRDRRGHCRGGAARRCRRHPSLSPSLSLAGTLGTDSGSLSSCASGYLGISFSLDLGNRIQILGIWNPPHRTLSTWDLGIWVWTRQLLGSLGDRRCCEEVHRRGLSLGHKGCEEVRRSTPLLVSLVHKGCCEEVRRGKGAGHCGSIGHHSRGSGYDPGTGHPVGSAGRSRSHGTTPPVALSHHTGTGCCGPRGEGRRGEGCTSQRHRVDCTHLLRSGAP